MRTSSVDTLMSAILMIMGALVDPYEKVIRPQLLFGYLSAFAGKSIFQFFEFFAKMHDFALLKLLSRLNPWAKQVRAQLVRRKIERRIECTPQNCDSVTENGSYSRPKSNFRLFFRFSLKCSAPKSSHSQKIGRRLILLRIKFSTKWLSQNFVQIKPSPQKMRNT